MPNHATKAYLVQGETARAIVLARDERRAIKKYQHALSQLYYGKEDKAAHIVAEIPASQVTFIHGSIAPWLVTFD